MRAGCPCPDSANERAKTAPRLRANETSPGNVPLLKAGLADAMIGFPLLLIPLAVYNIVIFLMPGVSTTEPLFRVPLMSGAEWPVTLSDILLALGMVLLLLEVIKGARPGAKYMMDHLLSLVVFAAAAAEFLLWPKFASSTFFLLTLLALVDFLAGIAQRARRPRQYAPAPAPAPSRRAEPPPAEPRFEPDPAPRAASPAPASANSAAPSATQPPSPAAMTETVPAEHPGADPAQPATPVEPLPSGSTPASPEESGR